MPLGTCITLDYRIPVGTKVEIHNHGSSLDGLKGELERDDNSSIPYLVRLDDGRSGWFDLNQVKILKEKSKTMSLTKSFNSLFLKEPEKSFRKAGVTDDSGMLTQEGLQIFMAWVLQKQGDAFKTEVVDAILKEQEEAKK